MIPSLFITSISNPKIYHLWIADNCLPQEQIHCLLWNCSFFTLFTRMCHQSPSSVIQSAPSHYISWSFTFNIILPITFRSAHIQIYCLQFHMHYPYLPCMLFTYICPAHLISCIWSPQHMQWTAQITKLLITQPLCDLLVTFTPVCPNIFLSTLFRGTLTLMLCTVWKNKFCTNTYRHYVTNTATKLWVPQNSQSFHRLYHRAPYLVAYIVVTTTSLMGLATQHPLLHPIALPLLHLQASS